MKPVIICVATDPETNQVRLKWPYLVSFRISSYTDYDWFHDYYFFLSLKPYLVSFRISSYTDYDWFHDHEEIVIMKPVIICVATDPETNQVRLE
jgi:hypothetical protein